MLTQIENFGFGNNVVIRKEDNIKIENCGIFKRNGLENPDIGFSFLSQFHKKGYALESASAMVKSAFENHGLTTLNAITDQKNINSQKLIKKLCFTYQKIIKLPNETVGLLLFELTKETYLKQ